MVKRIHIARLFEGVHTTPSPRFPLHSEVVCSKEQATLTIYTSLSIDLTRASFQNSCVSVCRMWGSYICTIALVSGHRSIAFWILRLMLRPFTLSVALVVAAASRDDVNRHMLGNCVMSGVSRHWGAGSLGRHRVWTGGFGAGGPDWEGCSKFRLPPVWEAV